MTIEQIVTIPNDYRILLELPRSVPAGVKARVEISIPDNYPVQFDEIEAVRKLLQKEMAEKGTLEIMATNGDGWKAHVTEHYAES